MTGHGRTIRTIIVGLALVLCAGLGACSSKSEAPQTQQSQTSAFAPTPGAQSGAQGAGCRQVDSVKFDKTKFVLHAGLAFGAFHRWIYKPLRSGGFKSGANGRVKALLKAGAAGLFTVHELKIAKQDAESSPTLCKIVAPLDNASAKLSGMTGALRSGKASDGDISSVNDALTSAQQTAGKNGVQTPDKVPSDAQLATGGK